MLNGWSLEKFCSFDALTGRCVSAVRVRAPLEGDSAGTYGGA